MKKTILIINFIFITLSLLSLLDFSIAEDKIPEQLVQDARAEIKTISVSELKRMLDDKEDLIVLDVRDKEEFEKGHIPGARHISRGLLEFMVADKIPDKDARIVVY